jgi:hypothetical protein
MSVHSFIGPIVHSTAQGSLFVHDNVQIDIKDGKVSLRFK